MLAHGKLAAAVCAVAIAAASANGDTNDFDEMTTHSLPTPLATMSPTLEWDGVVQGAKDGHEDTVGNTLANTDTHKHTFDHENYQTTTSSDKGDLIVDQEAPLTAQPTVAPTPYPRSDGRVGDDTNGDGYVSWKELTSNPGQLPNDLRWGEGPDPSTVTQGTAEKTPGVPGRCTSDDRHGDLVILATTSCCGNFICEPHNYENATSCSIDCDRSLDGTRAPTKQPTARPTPAPILPGTRCARGGRSVPDGYRGRGWGPENYCNWCQCQGGELLCTQNDCSKRSIMHKDVSGQLFPKRNKDKMMGTFAWERGMHVDDHVSVCSHTTCSFDAVSSGEYGDNVEGATIEVHHDHREHKGVKHYCQYNGIFDKCVCMCWDTSTSAAARCVKYGLPYDCKFGSRASSTFKFKPAAWEVVPVACAEAKFALPFDPTKGAVTVVASLAKYEMAHDAATVWVESTSETGFSVCASSADHLTASQHDVHVDYFAWQGSEGPWNQGSTNAAQGNSTAFAFPAGETTRCQTIDFNDDRMFDHHGKPLMLAGLALADSTREPVGLDASYWIEEVHGEMVQCTHCRAHRHMRYHSFTACVTKHEPTAVNTELVLNWVALMGHRTPYTIAGRANPYLTAGLEVSADVWLLRGTRRINCKTVEYGVMFPDSVGVPAVVVTATIEHPDLGDHAGSEFTYVAQAGRTSFEVCTQIPADARSNPTVNWNWVAFKK
jgi:hypothetical protein